MATLKDSVSKLVDANDNPQIGNRQAYVADAAAATATNPTAPAAYAAVVNMTDPVTKAQGETMSAALAALRVEVAAYELVISALVVDCAALRTTIASILDVLEEHGLMAPS